MCESSTGTILLQRSFFLVQLTIIAISCNARSPVKMFLSSRQAGYSKRQQGPKNLEICGVLESDKCEVSGRYFVVGGQIAGCRHILTGLCTTS